MELHSVFEDHQPIPIVYTCQGDDISPPLRFDSVPTPTVSLVLIVDDPDAPHGVFDHWIVWNLPPAIKAFSEGAPEIPLDSTAKEGMNHFGETGYRGPCPPAGKPHRYFFKLYAIDILLDLHEGSTKDEVEAAIKGHILEKTELVGTYQRK